MWPKVEEESLEKIPIKNKSIKKWYCHIETDGFSQKLVFRDKDMGLGRIPALDLESEEKE